MQAVALGQAMLDSGYIKGIETEEFTETHNLYKVSVPMDDLAEEDFASHNSHNGKSYGPYFKVSFERPTLCLSIVLQYRACCHQ